MINTIFLWLWALLLDWAAISGWVELCTGTGRRRGWNDPLAMTLLATMFGPILTWALVVGTMRGGQ